ncbi:PAS domain-containing hybrid sensor histidine kinase/response regulator [Erythrobacter sp. SN021]|uniref:hybrid sensor histidine kinase/response regulator n=1 Tax=Erythrobacter sp. SN021 TaxID=2912574 RepID=UPI001F23AC82|nr:PAS-domain containing protein [Erythrobacter sp. SN021]MCF8883731.1 PAS domain-containing hybrid sensor histidine kinase/response regulator [Erythrobacter sp. SN021]
MLFGTAIAAATLYLVGLFWLAARQDRAADAGKTLPPRQRDWVYGLSLAVYCTSWTFFGGVGTAATAGWHYLSIYLGPVLVFTLGFGLVRRILAQAKAQHSTSIADFLSARYGKSAVVAALVSLIATVGSLPYMALQLQSVGSSLLALDPGLEASVTTDELVLLVAGSMALFAILFGSRRGDRSGDNNGLVITIAVESVVKLVALVALAAFAVVLLMGTPQESTQVASPFSVSQLDARFAILTLIAACAALCLPRQFHMAFVEAQTDRATPTMRWLFPAYLVVTSLVIVPIVLAGLSVLPQSTNADMIVMALPLAAGSDALALLVFIGGFSASTGMIVVASVALSTMITNDLISPLLFRRELTGSGDRTRLAARLLMVRRLVIAGLLFFAYLFYLGFGAAANLAGLGTLAFAAASQFAPGLVIGMTNRHGNKVGMVSGLAAGFTCWLVLLIYPAATGQAPIFSIHPDMLVSGVILSLGANIAAFWFGSAVGRETLVDAAQAATFVGAAAPGGRPAFTTAKRIADIRLLLAQFVGKRRARASLEAMGSGLRDSDPASPEILSMAERLIAGVVGSSSARMLMTSWSQGDPVPLEQVVAMFDETNRRLTFSGDLLRLAIENIDQGVALVDAEMKLVAWNSRYQEMFALPDHLASVGTSIADLIRYNLQQSGMPEEEIEEQVARRLDHMRAGRQHRLEREQPDGRIMRIVGNPAPGGGYVTSYSDITADRRAEQALEQKVADRTRQLSEANAALEAATRSKTRFLAAASHDLIQPLNAARLFASALGEEVRGRDQLVRLVRDLDGSISSADRVIRTLLDISKLDGGGIKPRPDPVALNDILDEMEREFAVQARDKGLDLRRVHTSAWVTTDRGLLTSVVRNLTSNAIRYTRKGGVLLGVRRSGEEVELCVYDTGPGIAEDDVERLFGEFQRGESGDREGLGLGLAIVRRIASLLQAEVVTRSVRGSGSRFAVRLPVLRRGARAAPERMRRASTLLDAKVLVVDNDPSALSATAALLGKWGLRVVCASGKQEALAVAPTAPDVVIMDFRLDGRDRGDGVFEDLCKVWNARPPAILLTAEAGEETGQAAARMGANRLLKPSSPAALRALISDCVARRSATGQSEAGSAFS